MNDRADAQDAAPHEAPSLDSVARAVFEAAPDGIVVLDAQRRVLDFNASFLALWHFPADMLARREAAEMYAYITQQLVDPAGDPQQPLATLVLRDGRVFERQVTALQLPGPGLCQVIRWRDISDRHRAEQALAQSQARLSAVVEHALNGILLASDEGRYVDANPAACEMTGYTRDELLSMKVPELVVPGSVDLDTVWAGFLQAGRSRGRVKLRRKDGTVIVVAFNARAQVLPGLNLSILSDVTEDALAEARLETLAQTDALTGISNRRHFLSLAADEMTRAGRHDLPLALLMIDLDHFKQVNDRHGHAAGDEVLRSFAQTVGREIRQGEHFARLGGEEFAVLLPQTGLSGATVFAQRLLKTVREHPARLGDTPLPVTASIGVAALPPGAAARCTIDQLLGLADRALYRSKTAGRDRIEISNETP